MFILVFFSSSLYFSLFSFAFYLSRSSVVHSILHTTHDYCARLISQCLDPNTCICVFILSLLELFNCFDHSLGIEWVLLSIARFNILPLLLQIICLVFLFLLLKFLITCPFSSLSFSFFAFYLPSSCLCTQFILPSSDAKLYFVFFRALMLF